MTRFKARTRVELEDIEARLLAPYAARSRGRNQTRMHAEPEHGYRTNFQRDRDRIIHSRAFRRLKHKRQVFLVTTGDHYRTRLTHTIEVVQLSRSLARALGANEDLAEAAALGHDLGHTPFGHIGEVVINQILKGKDDLDGLIDRADCGGFKHNYQSVRVVDSLEKKYEFDGLNLTLDVREAILKHTRLLREQIRYPDWPEADLNMELPQSVSLEGQIVAICDEIAQRTHDLEDGLRAGFIPLDDVRRLAIVAAVEDRAGLSETNGLSDHQYSNILIKKLVDPLISDVVQTTLKNVGDYHDDTGSLYPFRRQVVDFSRQTDPMQMELDRFITRRIIRRKGVEWHDEMAFDVIRHLCMAYIRRPQEMGRAVTGGSDAAEIVAVRGAVPGSGARDQKDLLRHIADFVAGMTDHFAILEYERLVGALNWPRE